MLIINIDDSAFESLRVYEALSGCQEIDDRFFYAIIPFYEKYFLSLHTEISKTYILWIGYTVYSLNIPPCRRL